MQLKSASQLKTIELSCLKLLIYTAVSLGEPRENLR